MNLNKYKKGENMLIGQDANLKGTLGYKGERGYSAYETAVQNGFNGTEEEWLDTLGTLEPNSVEFKSNKTTEVNNTSTDNQYPSAKATYDAIQDNIENAIDDAKLTPQTTKTETDTDVYSCNYINSIENKISRKYAIAYPTAQQSLASNTQISLNAFYKNVGNKFTLSNNSVVVGAGVSKIAISGCIFAEEVNNTNYVWGQIKKNNVSIITCIVSSTCGFVSTPLPYQIIEVQEGDIISLYVDSTAGGTSRIGTENTYIQLEIVE
jgi:CRISPR/Cas system CSM-associated protein Csm3 (group 7 of RAMP superfamily)